MSSDSNAGTTNLGAVGEKRPREEVVEPNPIAVPQQLPTAAPAVAVGVKTAVTASAGHPSAPSVLASLASPEAFEKRHVHDVYNVIAPHFSATRYKPWPRVKAFVEGRVAAALGGNDIVAPSVETAAANAGGAAAGSSAAISSASGTAPYGVLLVDVGCGNGKNMCIHDLNTCYGVGCDRSLELMRAAEFGARRTRKVELVEVDRAAKGSNGTAGGDDSSAAAASSEQKKKTEDGDGLGGETGNAAAVGGNPSSSSAKAQPQKTKKQIKVSTEVAVPEALQRGLEHCGSDAIATPYRSSVFDIVISIAVIHHFSTFERRLMAVRELLRLCVPTTGRVLIYVWAKEQAKDRGEGVDVFVPWALHNKFSERNKDEASKTAPSNPQNTAGVLQRYYHLFVKGELEALCEAINDPQYDEALSGVGGSAGANGAPSCPPIRCKVEEGYYDQENWCVVLSRTQ